MIRFRCLTALLSASFLFQSILVGSGVLCDARATVATPDGPRGQAATHVMSSTHAMASHGAQGDSRDASTMSSVPDADGCAGMAAHGCGVPNAGHCGLTASCGASPAVSMPSLLGDSGSVHTPAVLYAAQAPPAWILSPLAPPPRA